MKKRLASLTILILFSSISQIQGISKAEDFDGVWFEIANSQYNIKPILRSLGLNQNGIDTYLANGTLTWQIIRYENEKFSIIGTDPDGTIYRGVRFLNKNDSPPSDLNFLGKTFKTDSELRDGQLVVHAYTPAGVEILRFIRELVSEDVMKYIYVNVRAGIEGFNLYRRER